jgi:hypothetical protein
MDSIDNGIKRDKYIFKCTKCASLMIFEMTFHFETDIDVYCPCTALMEYIGSK